MLDRVESHKYILASGGADGVVKVWAAADASADWTCIHTLNHAEFEHRPKKQEDEPPQIYALKFITHWKGIADESELKTNNFLMTSSDDFIHLWEIVSPFLGQGELQTASLKNLNIELEEVMSFRFTCLDDTGFGVSVSNVTKRGLPINSDKESEHDTKRQKTGTSFGGDRNPDNLVFVFDASYNHAIGLLGVALSDGSVRLVNGRGVCVQPIRLPGIRSHLTAIGWDASGKRLASCVATGFVVLWAIDGDCNQVTISCDAILEGGHIPGRPLYGAAYCGADLLLSWGADGRLCLWDSWSEGKINAPLSTLVARSDYPIFGMDSLLVAGKDGHPDQKGDPSKQLTARIACGVGGEGGFIGVPVFLYEVFRGRCASRKDSDRKTL
jgi:WD40 repeat protein